MKKLLYVFCLSTLAIFAQETRKIEIRLDTVNSQYFDPQYKKDAEEAFRIASAILSSEEFQAEIASLTFDCESFCTGCKKIPTHGGRISGTEVLNKLFRESSVVITLDLKESGGALGETTRDSYKTTAWYENIIDDMPEFKENFAYGLAVNICHEYMHQVGFCHTYCTSIWPFCTGNSKLREKNLDPVPNFYKEDVTYRVGWAAFYILKRWKDENNKILVGKN